MTAPLVRRRVIAHGRVQGVSYRYACQREADRRGVAGWARNRSDGTVEAVFEGAGAEVDAMVDWARSGPSAARVERLDVVDEPVEGIAGFHIWPGWS